MLRGSGTPWIFSSSPFMIPRAIVSVVELEVR
jgi:hypothetical protein